jgi:hypothetical protein
MVFADQVTVIEPVAKTECSADVSHTMRGAHVELK